MIIDMYITGMSGLLAGIFFMIFTKTRIYHRYKRPIDGGRYFKDHKRILGDHKTMIGFWSMIFFGALSQAIWGAFCPGKTAKGIKGAVFFIADQIDSVVGLVLVLAIFTHMTIERYFQYVLLGGISHIVVSFILYRCKLRKNL